VPDRTREPAHLETDASTWLSAFKPVLLRRSGVVLGLWGDAGIGKTFAAKGALRELSCRSLSVHATAPLSEIVRVLPKPKRLPVWAERNLERLERGDHLEIADAANVLAAVLNGLAPVVLHVEDIHEANPERLELWTILAGIALRSKGVGLLVTSRVPPPEAFKAVHLEPLSRAQSDALIEREAGSEVPSQALEWMYHRAAGNPLFTLEYFRFLARMGYLWSDAKRWHWRAPEGQLVPVTIEALIESVILRIKDAPELVSALEAKAILPPGTSESLWANVSALEPQELNAAQIALEERGLLLHGEFAHPLYREVVVRNLSVNRRRGLSRRAFRAFEHEDIRAAAGFVQDANLEPEEALSFFERATEIARAVGDATQAARFLAQASEYARGEARGRLAFEAARTLQYSDAPKTIQLAQIALREGVDACSVISALTHALGQWGAYANLDAILETVSDEQLDRTALKIQMHQAAGDYATVLRLWEDHPDLHTQARPEMLCSVAWALLGLGQSQTALELALATLRLPNLSDSNRSTLLGVTAILHAQEGRFEDADADWLTSIDLERRLDQPRKLANALHNRAISLKNAGRFKEMVASLEEAILLRRDMGDRRAYTRSVSALMEIMIERGQYEEAEDRLSEVRQMLEPDGVTSYLVTCDSRLVSLYLASLNPMNRVLALKHASTALENARQLANTRLICETLYDASLAHTANANPQVGLALAEEAIALAAAKLDDPLYRWRNLVPKAHALEALGQREEALHAFREAELIARDSRAENQLIVFKVGLEVDRLTHNVERARERLHWFQREGLDNAANLVRRYFPMLETSDPQTIATPRTSSEPAARLELLGPARVIVNNEPISGRGSKRLELLVVLLEARIRGRAEVSQLELCDALYPDVLEPQAAQSLKKMVQLVRGNLGKGAILTTNAGYALGEVASDAETFLETLDTRLWRGAYLEGVNLSRDDETVPEVLHGALKSKAEALLATDPKEAARTARLLVDAEPYDRACLELALCALRASDNHRSLARLYEDARERFQEIGEVLPERWQDALEPQAV
jgi:tetratricopeptide (TPR) repeat protein